jgi:predicted site-specific integrase-resolvase
MVTDLLGIVLQRSMTLPRYLTSAEVAEAIGVSEVTLRRWRRMGLGPTYARVGQRPRYPLESVEEWMADRMVVITEDPESEQ